MGVALKIFEIHHRVLSGRPMVVLDGVTVYGDAVRVKSHRLESFLVMSNIA